MGNEKKRVTFHNLGIHIHDYILGIRHTIPFQPLLVLNTLKRFNKVNKSYKMICKETRLQINPDIGLEKQGIIPGDIICIYPSNIL